MRILVCSPRLVSRCLTSSFDLSLFHLLWSLIVLSLPGTRLSSPSEVNFLALYIWIYLETEWERKRSALAFIQRKPQVQGLTERRRNITCVVIYPWRRTKDVGRKASHRYVSQNYYYYYFFNDIRINGCPLN